MSYPTVKLKDISLIKILTTMSRSNLEGQHSPQEPVQKALPIQESIIMSEKRIR